MSMRELRPRILIPVLDMVALAYLWSVANLFFGLILYGKELFTIPHWGWMALFAVEGTAIWETFGRSLGMKIMGRDLLPRGSPAKRLRYLFLWHLFILGLPVWLLLRRVPQERGSGLSLTERTPGEAPVSWYRTSQGLVLALILVFTFAAAWVIAKVNPLLFIQRAKGTGLFWKELVTPRPSEFIEGFKLIIQTLFMAIMATVFAVIAAVPLSFLAARNLMRGPLARPIYTVVRGTASFMRSIDAVIWAIVISVGVGVGAFAGTLALLVHSIVDLIKLYSEQLESIDQGPIEAITATGANKLQVIRYGIIPQIINPYISFTLYRWDINVRMSTIIGLVGGGGIGFRLVSFLRESDLRGAGTLTLLIIAMVWAIDYLSARLREKLA